MFTESRIFHPTSGPTAREHDPIVLLFGSAVATPRTSRIFLEQCLMKGYPAVFARGCSIADGLVPMLLEKRIVKLSSALHNALLQRFPGRTFTVHALSEGGFSTFACYLVHRLTSGIPSHCLVSSRSALRMSDPRAR